MQPAPVILFVYSRPWHTEQTLRALMANRLASETELHIYCDGPRATASVDELKNIGETRRVARSEKWCKEVFIHESGTNLGLANSIVKGVTEIVDREGRVIVLEDDIITSPGFLQFMNESLDLYASEEKVMHISGYMYPLKKSLPSLFFFPPSSCWGWATWKRAWQHYTNDPNYLLQQLEARQMITAFDLGGNAQFSKDLRANVEGTMKTWAVLWYASVFLKGGFSLHPYPSMTRNIGMDGTGENCHVTSKYAWDNLPDTTVVKRIPLRNNQKVIRLMNEFYGKKQYSLIRKTVSRTLKKLGFR